MSMHSEWASHPMQPAKHAPPPSMLTDPAPQLLPVASLTRCLSQASLTLAALALLKPGTVATRSAAEWPSRMAQVCLPSLCTIASAFLGPTPGSLAASNKASGPAMPSAQWAAWVTAAVVTSGLAGWCDMRSKLCTVLTTPHS